MFEIVTDSTRQLMAAGLLFSYCGFCIWVWRGYRAKQQPMHTSINDRLIVWASQSGNAQQLAQQLHQQLTTTGKSAHCLALDQLSSTHLQYSKQIIFIVSTFGDGEAPDHARQFLSRLSADCNLQHLQIHILGLGDSSYPDFCAFATQLQTRLVAQGAHVCLPLMTVDTMQASDLELWNLQIAQLLSIPAQASSHYQPAWFTATLIERTHLNPFSTSPGLYKLRFKTEHNRWQAGDTVLIHPLNNPEHRTREYSIASSVQSNYLELIVRAHYDENNTVGLCSGWLCHSIDIHQSIEFSPCSKPNFHAVHNSKPAIFIGAGSGIAGLRAHISERPTLSQNWLILGERSPLTDKILAEELGQWHKSQHLTHLDYAFSRDPISPRYVQDYLHEHQQRLSDWLAQGATIYLCGSLQGMGRGVQQTLTQLLGEEQMYNLQQQGRYRADLY